MRGLAGRRRTAGRAQLRGAGTQRGAGRGLRGVAGHLVPCWPRRLEPGNATYQGDFGSVLLDEGRDDDAAAALREAARLDPDPANKQIADLRTALSTAADERIVTFVMNQVDQAWTQNTLEQRGVVRSEYVGHVDRITRDRLPVLRVPFKNLEDAQRAEGAERTNLVHLNSSRRRLIVVIIVLVLVAAAGGIVTLALYGSQLGLLARSLIFLGLGAIGVLVLGAIASWARLQAQGYRFVTQASLVLADQFRTLVTILILEPAITASLAIVWKDSPADPVRIQDGPELSAKADISNVVSTQAHSRLTIALNRKNGASAWELLDEARETLGLQPLR